MHINQRWRRRIAVFFCLVLFLSNLILTATAQQRRQTASAKKVRLIVGVVIDQFRYDYLTRFEDQFGEGGFKRLLNGGAVFTNANYIHTPTFTACGHATFMSGATPAMNGIIANEWFDRKANKVVTSVSDDNTKLLGGNAGASGSSPRKMLGSTLGDELKLTTIGRAKVIGVSHKDRSAILPVGKRPDGAYWFSLDNGNFVSSDYYFNDLPDWVKKFNSEQHCNRYFGAKWERLLPESAYQRSLPDDVEGEKNTYGNTFPHVVTGNHDKLSKEFYDDFEKTPFANDYLLDFAKAAIENEKLGADDVTDLLTISFSANDLLGHKFGPYSQEVQDMTLRTDQLMAKLLTYLDQKIGAGQWVLALTADHGVGPVPEQTQKLGYGGRVTNKQVIDAVEAALDKQFGEEKWVLSFTYGNVYLDEVAAAKRKVSIEEIERVANQALKAVPGIAEAFTHTQLSAGRLPANAITKSVANGFFSSRNGNLIVIPQPFYLLGTPDAASHGTPYEYDTHVPVLFYGAGVAAGSFASVSSPADIAPTLATLLKLETPSNSVGHVLMEAIKSSR
ncbi:MAG TPA: alkaline phosphatase family protein [Blastocatellia bacterium]|nr:alkaline phosphatase family protein [Blastocatellia bacterium]HMX28304.1 alkaline phosphatase family protein [Blastocatellia bacterium]HMY73242.1 alkaline phosphatase family protein [Blastocatellia bacterium]HMZ17149.1 alkaline phosphatase family protein [Blastocatellia bacterium]HNG33845.1 alkaline phosphatase family protein [Blastocatellia bacterium]